jgi:transmembrane sensor
METLAGTITEADDHLLQQLLKKDISVKIMWDALEQENMELKGEAFFLKLDAGQELANVKSKLKQDGNIKKLSFWRNTAAAVLVLTVLGFLITRFNTRSDEVAKIAKTNIPSEKKVQLLLENGQVIAIDHKKANAIKLKDVTIDVSEKGLRYASAANGRGMNTLYVPAKEDYKITLSDGTKVWLNAESKLRFPFLFEDKLREVYIEGEAYFEVAKLKGKPFIVHTANTAVRVLGTSFNVNTYAGAEKIALIEGKVQLSTIKGNSLTLDPGYEAGFSSSSGFTKTQFDKNEVLSWMSGIYYFHNMPLGRMASVIQRWFDLKVVLDRPELSDYPISGLLEKKQLDAFLSDLKTTAQINYYFSGNELHIK